MGEGSRASPLARLRERGARGVRDDRKRVFHHLTHRIGLQRADDYDDHAVRAIVRSVELANRLDVKAGEGVGIAEQRQSVGVLGELLGEQRVASGTDGVGVVQGVLIAQDEVSLLLKRVGG